MLGFLTPALRILLLDLFWDFQRPFIVIHSFRHGGATHDHLVAEHSLTYILNRGRWSGLKVTKRYIQEGQALLLASKFHPWWRRRCGCGQAPRCGRGSALVVDSWGALSASIIITGCGDAGFWFVHELAWRCSIGRYLFRTPGSQGAGSPHP